MGDSLPPRGRIHSGFPVSAWTLEVGSTRLGEAIMGAARPTTGSASDQGRRRFNADALAVWAHAGVLGVAVADGIGDTAAAYGAAHVAADTAARAAAGGRALAALPGAGGAGGGGRKRPRRAAGRAVRDRGRQGRRRARRRGAAGRGRRDRVGRRLP